MRNYHLTKRTHKTTKEQWEAQKALKDQEIAARTSQTHMDVEINVPTVISPRITQRKLYEVPGKLLAVDMGNDRPTALQVTILETSKKIPAAALHLYFKYDEISEPGENGYKSLKYKISKSYSVSLRDTPKPHMKDYEQQVQEAGLMHAPVPSFPLVSEFIRESRGYKKERQEYYFPVENMDFAPPFYRDPKTLYPGQEVPVREPLKKATLETVENSGLFSRETLNLAKKLEGNINYNFLTLPYEKQKEKLETMIFGPRHL